jgi:hypothetical protein
MTTSALKDATFKSLFSQRVATERAEFSNPLASAIAGNTLLGRMRLGLADKLASSQVEGTQTQSVEAQEKGSMLQRLVAGEGIVQDFKLKVARVVQDGFAKPTVSSSSSGGGSNSGGPATQNSETFSTATGSSSIFSA